MSFIDCSLVTLIPDNNSASVSFGTIISISDNNSLGNAFAGAGFNTVVTPCDLAISNADIIAGMGTSNCATTKSALIIASFALITSSGVIVIFAPP